ncbi:MAG: DUF167 domain-containing protein [Candidatus Woesearchaeota archaeon]
MIPNLKPHIKKNLLSIKVIPNAKTTKLEEDNQQLKLYLKAVPEKDKANKSLIKYFKDQHKLNVRIKSGSKSRNKVLEIVV